MSFFPRLSPIFALCTLGCPPPYDPADHASATDSETTEESPSSEGLTIMEATATITTTDLPTTTGSTADTTTGSGSSTSTTATGDTTDADELPETPGLSLSYSPIKQFDFMWAPAAGAEYYQVLERPDSGAPAWAQLGNNLTESSLSWKMPLHLRADASYSLRACNTNGCNEAASVVVDDAINSAVGYIKASNAEAGDAFGVRVAMSADGNTLVVAAETEDSGALGINGDQSINGSPGSGAVYVFTRTGAVWSQQAYLKSFNVNSKDYFGRVAISADGKTIAVGAYGEDSAATGVGGDRTDNSEEDSGAVYVFVHKAGAWAQQAYIKASNTDRHDQFGISLALAADGNTLAVGAPSEGSDATGIDGNTRGGIAEYSGAVYVYSREDASWSHSAYVKASNTGAHDQFGRAVALSGGGTTLAVGAPNERSASTGINGDEMDNSKVACGAVYIFESMNGAWSQQAYVKSSNSDYSDNFGASVALSFNGDVLAAGAYGEASASTEINGDQANNDAYLAGAVYVFSRVAQTWEQRAYIKAPNADAEDMFGYSVALSTDGDLLLVGAPMEDGGGVGVLADLSNKDKPVSGAAYAFVHSGDEWSYKSYIKAPNPDNDDRFGLKHPLIKPPRTREERRVV